MKKAVIRSDIKTGIKVAGFMDFITKEFDDKEILLEMKKYSVGSRALDTAPNRTYNHKIPMNENRWKRKSIYRYSQYANADS